MIRCHRCGKQNQNHYKFCLGCGADLTSAPNAPASGGEVGTMNTMLADDGHAVPEPTRPGGLPGAPLSPPPSGPPRAGRPPGVPAASSSKALGVVAAPITGGNTAASPWSPATSAAVPLPGVGETPARNCPSCGAEIPPAFKFCGVCGFRMPESESAPEPAIVETTPKASGKAIMTLIRPDGSEGGTHELRDGENKIGRMHGEIFENDGYLSPTHAVLLLDFQAKTALIRDLGSLNGVFVKMITEEEIKSGQIMRIGQELLRFDTIIAPEPLDDGTEVMGSPNPGYWGKLTVVIGHGVDGSSYPLLGDSVTLGRERGEINFPDDGYVSGLHARLSSQSGRVMLSDLGSSNGTFIKVQGERQVGQGSFVLLGQQLFRLTLPFNR